MKIKFCVFVAALFGLLSSGLHAANLKVNLAPTQAVNAGAQWQVDGGAWKNSGATVNGLANGSHQVGFKAVNGWIAPAPANVTLNGGTTTQSYTYVQAASLKITLTPGSAQWRVDGGVWQASAATVGNLAPGSHTIEYGSVAGYTAPASESVTLTAGQLQAFSRSYTQLAQLTVTLTPGSAQWRVDGGTWRNSGTTATNLTPGSHTVEYAALAGYTAPAAESVSLAAGQSLPLSRAYVQLAQLTVTLSPSAAQWRVDGGAWRNSGTTATNLSPGSHTIDYAVLSGYIAPASESVSLAAGQSQSVDRAYVQLAQLTVTLAPANALWRVDGGTWLASGTTVSNLALGNHNVEYQSLAGYTAPSSESISLSAGQSLALSRAHVQLAEVTVTLSPASANFRIDGGAWVPSGSTAGNLAPGSHTIDYQGLAGYTAPASESVSLLAGQSLALNRAYVQLAQVTVALAPASANFRIDGGAWLPSGTAVADLNPGVHVIEYQLLPGYNPPASESISLSPGQSLSLDRAHVQLGQLTITLSHPHGKFSVDGGAWLASGTTVSNLTPGTHAISYSTVLQKASPADETITLAAGEALSLERTYIGLAQIGIGLVPASGEWRVNGGAWQAAGTSLFVLPGTYTLEYSAIPLFDAPASETITLGESGMFGTTRYYVSQKPTLKVNLAPNTGQWRLDGGAWQQPGATIAELDAGPHTIDYTDIGGEHAPLASESVTLALREHQELFRSYPFKRASVTVTMNPAAGTLWRLDGPVTGSWQVSGATVSELAPANNWTLSFSALANYITPAAIPVTLAPGQNATFSASYTPLPAAIRVSVVPFSGQWRITPPGGSAGAWNNTGVLLSGLPPGDYFVEYSPVANYTPPPAETITLTPNQTLEFVRQHTPPPSLTVHLQPETAQWRVDGGAWRNSGTKFTGISVGTHTIEYSQEPMHHAPSSETITVGVGEQVAFSRAYTRFTQILMNFIPDVGQWRLDGGPWRTSGLTEELSPGQHTIDYLEVPGYGVPPSETITLTPNELHYLYREYASANFSVTLGTYGAQWRVDGGEWRNSGAIANLAPGDHLVEYSEVSGYITPQAETVTLTLGDNPQLVRNYTQLASLYLTLNTYGAMWRIDGGEWHQSIDPFAFNLLPGQHMIEYSPVEGYITPASTTVELVSGHNQLTAPTYVQLAYIYMSSSATYGAKWRIDGGEWHDSSYPFLFNLSLGQHTIDYSPVEGYITPASTTVELVSGENHLTVPAYVQLAYVYMSSSSTYGAKWRIDGGEWHDSTQPFAYNLSLGQHTIDYSPVAGYITPASTTVELVSGYNQLTAPTYVQLVDFSVQLNPSFAQWRLDGGAWNSSGAVLRGLDPAGGALHVVEFSTHEGFVTPAPYSVGFASGYNLVLTRIYDLDPAFSINPSLAALTISLNPTRAEWRVDGGAWRTSGATLHNLAVGAHTVEYNPLPDYLSPPAETVTLAAGSNPILFTSYISLDPAQLTVTTNQATGQWRIFPVNTPAGGTWNANGATVGGINPGRYQIDYSEVPGFSTPDLTSVELQPDSSQTLNPSYYTANASLKITLNPASARWRAGGGAWRNSGSPTYLGSGSHVIEYETILGRTAPATETVTLGVGENLVLSRNYQ